jgi:transcriptional regulator of met regulon
MTRKRYNIALSRSLARKLETLAAGRHCGKSALVEEALQLVFEPQAMPGVEDATARRLEQLNRTVTRIDRDLAITAETVGLFVRYFLTITPPLPESEQEPARLLGRKRFDVFVDEIARRMGGDRRLATEVLARLNQNEPDQFTTPSYGSEPGPAEKTEPAAVTPAGEEHA